MFRKRILSWIIDMGIMLVPLYLFGFFTMVLYGRVHDDIMNRIIYPIMFAFFILTYIEIFLRDAIFGKSIGKKIMGLEIKSRNDQKVSFCRLILRNITFFIWPIEVIILLCDRERIGDRLAKTMVIERITHK